LLTKYIICTGNHHQKKMKPVFSDIIIMYDYLEEIYECFKMPWDN